MEVSFPQPHLFQRRDTPNFMGAAIQQLPSALVAQRNENLSLSSKQETFPSSFMQLHYHSFIDKDMKRSEMLSSDQQQQQQLLQRQQQSDSIPSSQQQQQQQQQQWVWVLTMDQLQSIPLYYHNIQRTSISLSPKLQTIIPLECITKRISCFMKQHSITCVYPTSNDKNTTIDKTSTNSKHDGRGDHIQQQQQQHTPTMDCADEDYGACGRITCTLDNGRMKFVVQLWKIKANEKTKTTTTGRATAIATAKTRTTSTSDSNDTIIVEIQRRRGCCFELQGIRRQIFHYILRGATSTEIVSKCNNAARRVLHGKDDTVTRKAWSHAKSTTTGRACLPAFDIASSFSSSDMSSCLGNRRKKRVNNCYDNNDEEEYSFLKQKFRRLLPKHLMTDFSMIRSSSLLPCGTLEYNHKSPIPTKDPKKTPKIEDGIHRPIMEEETLQDQEVPNSYCNEGVQSRLTVSSSCSINNNSNGDTNKDKDYNDNENDHSNEHDNISSSNNNSNNKTNPQDNTADSVATNNTTASHHSSAYDICLDMLESDNLDETMLGMESLSILTNPLKVDRNQAEALSRCLVYGQEQHHQEQHEQQAIMKAFEDDQEGCHGGDQKDQQQQRQQYQQLQEPSQRKRDSFTSINTTLSDSTWNSIAMNSSSCISDDSSTVAGILLRNAMEDHFYDTVHHNEGTMASSCFCDNCSCPSTSVTSSSKQPSGTDMVEIAATASTGIISTAQQSKCSAEWFAVQALCNALDLVVAQQLQTIGNKTSGQLYENNIKSNDLCAGLKDYCNKISNSMAGMLGTQQDSRSVDLSSTFWTTVVRALVHHIKQTKVCPEKAALSIRCLRHLRNLSSPASSSGSGSEIKKTKSGPSEQIGSSGSSLCGVVAASSLTHDAFLYGYNPIRRTSPLVATIMAAHEHGKAFHALLERECALFLGRDVPSNQPSSVMVCSFQAIN